MTAILSTILNFRVADGLLYHCVLLWAYMPSFMPDSLSAWFFSLIWPATASSRFRTLQPSLSHRFDRVKVRQQARPSKISYVLLIFVFLDDASTVGFVSYQRALWQLNTICHFSSWWAYPIQTKTQIIFHDFENRDRIKICLTLCQ